MATELDMPTTYELQVTLTRHIDDEPQPGLIEAQLVDVNGDIWTFVDKFPIFTPDYPATYPATGHIRCQVLQQQPAEHPGGMLLVSTEEPFHVRDIHEDRSSFWVPADQVTEYRGP